MNKARRKAIADVIDLLYRAKEDLDLLREEEDQGPPLSLLGQVWNPGNSLASQ